MNDVLAYLEEREEEFARHLSIAQILQARVDDVKGDAAVEVRHVNTIKSGLLIHLYNIVEAITTRTLDTVGRTVVAERPRRWTVSVRKEWVRASIWSGEDRVGDGAVNKLADISAALASGETLPAFKVKGEPGSWNDDSIKKVAERLGCALVLSEEVRRAAYERVYRDETTALGFLAKRRNAIAHGSSTFEGGANDLTLDELEKLSLRVLPYLRAVAESYREFLTSRNFLLPEESAA
jgi:MAE_28990/MAE_18760-like HEPN